MSLAGRGGEEQTYGEAWGSGWRREVPGVVLLLARGGGRHGEALLTAILAAGRALALRFW
jgi:hypothetical protein